MKRLFFLTVVLMLLMAACKQEKNKPVILTQIQMEKVIWDIMQVDEYANNYLSRDSINSIDKQRLQLYLEVFQLHHITRDDFNASFRYYSSKPDMMKVIFDSLTSKGELQRRKLIPLK